MSRHGSEQGSHVLSHRWWILASVACGTFMATLDSSIVNIALPTLTQYFHTDLYQVKWVVIVYLLVLTTLLLPFGRLSDQLGRKPVFQAGYLIFVIGSVLCGCSSSLLALVIFRGLQGIGGSLLMVNGPAIIAATFGPTERGGALGTLAMVVSAGLISGPSIGGILVSELGWQSIFWVNAPIGLLGTFLAYRYVQPELSRRAKAAFDWAGALLQMLLLFSIILLLDPPHVAISGSAPLMVPRWVILIIMLLVGSLFIRVELDAPAPVFDLTLLHNRVFWSSNLAGFLIAVAFTAVSVLMPFFLEENLHFAPNQAGIFMTAIPLVIFIVAPISGRLSDRFSGPGLSFAGAAIGGFGLLAMGGAVGPGLNTGMTPLAVVSSLCVIGFSMGLFQSPNNNSIMSSVPLDRLGAASAFLATVRNLGLVVGTSLTSGLFIWRKHETGDSLAAIHTAHLVAAGMAFLSMLACLGRAGGAVRAAAAAAASGSTTLTRPGESGPRT